MNLTRNQEVVGSIPGLAQWNPALLWLWYRPVYTSVVYTSDATPSLRTSICYGGSGGKGEKVQMQVDHLLIISLQAVLLFALRMKCSFPGAL